MIDDLWEKLLGRIRPAVRGQNRRYSARFQTSDVLQESAVQIIGEVEKSDSEDFDPPQAWLNKVGRGHAAKLRDHHGAQKRSTRRESPVDANPGIAGGAAPDEIVERRELASRVVLCLAQLDADQRTIIDLHFTKQHSFAEIARQMERPPDWVRRQYKKAIASLRTLIGETGD